MKRFLIFLVVFVLLGAGFAYLVDNQSSYVLLSYGSHVLESSIWFFLMANVVALMLFLLTLRLLSLLWAPKKRFNRWADARKVEAAKRDYFQAMQDYELGVWNKAYKRFKNSALHLDMPLSAYLFAARSAQQLSRDDNREEMLQLALEAEPNAATTVVLVRAELLLIEGKESEAEKLLRDLSQSNQKNKFIKNKLESVNG